MTVDMQIRCLPVNNASLDRKAVHTLRQSALSCTPRADQQCVQASLRIEDSRLGKLNHSLQASLTADQVGKAISRPLLPTIYCTVEYRPPLRLADSALLDELVQNATDICPLELHRLRNVYSGNAGLILAFRMKPDKVIYLFFI